MPSMILQPRTLGPIRVFIGAHPGQKRGGSQVHDGFIERGYLQVPAALQRVHGQGVVGQILPGMNDMQRNIPFTG